MTQEMKCTPDFEGLSDLLYKKVTNKQKKVIIFKDPGGWVQYVTTLSWSMTKKKGSLKWQY